MKIKLFLLYTLCTLFLNIIAKSTNNEIALETVSTKKTNPIDENKNSFRKRFIKALQKKIKGSPIRYALSAFYISTKLYSDLLLHKSNSLFHIKSFTSGEENINEICIESSITGLLFFFVLYDLIKIIGEEEEEKL